VFSNKIDSKIFCFVFFNQNRSEGCATIAYRYVTLCSHLKKRRGEYGMVILQDLAFPDSGRDLQGPSDSSDDSGSPINHVAIYAVGGGLLLLLCAIWSSISCLATWRDVNASTSAPAAVRPQDERAGDAIQSTLLQRKHAILKLFRTSRVTMVR
jgi:hypothetical protein